MKKILLLLTYLLHFVYLYGQPSATLLADLSPGSRNTNFSSLVPFNGKLVFVADTSIYPSPSKLWITDGTAAGTHIIKYFLPNRAPNGFQRMGDKLFFVAGDSVSGSELWVTDGNASGTKMVHDIFPGPNDGVKHLPILGNGKLYFAADDGIHGTELWMSDGTSDGTKLFVDVDKAPTASSNPDNLLVANETLFFTSSNSGHYNTLWAIDFNGQNLRQILSGCYVDQLFSSGNNIFFNVTQYYGNGYPYFSVQAYNTQSKLVTVIKNGIFHRNDFATLGKKTYFLAKEFSGGYGPEGIWETDGTANGTKHVVEQILVNCASSTQIIGLTAYNGKLYFGSGDPSGFDRLWAIENNPRTILPIKQFSSTDGFPGYLKHLMNVNGYMYFKAWDDSSKRINLWRSDGTTDGTVMVEYSGTKTSNTFNTCAWVGSSMTLVDSTLYFINSYDSANIGFELYRITATPPKDSVQDSLNNNSHTHWVAHPSPTSDYLHFDLVFDPAKNYSGLLSTIDGRVVKRIDNATLTLTAPSTFSIDVRDLRNGIYIFRFSDETRSITQKISIQH